MNVQQIAQLINRTDHNGNYIRLDPVTMSLHLKRDGESKERAIGFIKEENGIAVYYKKESEAHIFLKSKAWSINRQVLEGVEAIEYETDLATYRISISEAFKNGITYKWDKSIVDKKLYVPIRCWDTTYKHRTEDTMIGKFGYEWYSELKEIFTRDYISSLNKNLSIGYKENTLYPAKEDVFLPFRLTPFMGVKAVVVAPSVFPSKGSNGLAFGFEGEGSVPAMTKLFLKEIETDFYGGQLMWEKDNSMRQYAEKGILMLNYLATVHKDGNYCTGIGWELFMKDVIKLLSDKKQHIAFFIYGKQIEHLAELIDTAKHFVVTNELIYDPGYKPSKYFTICNEFLHSRNLEPIAW